MPFTNYGAQAMAWQLGSNLSNNYIQYFAIGIGSSLARVTDVTLVTESGTRAVITGSPNFATPLKVTFQGDFSSSIMSGVQLTEFGIFASGAATTGSVWQREAFPSINFDGSNELQIATTIQFIPG